MPQKPRHANFVVYAAEPCRTTLEEMGRHHNGLPTQGLNLNQPQKPSSELPFGCGTRFGSR
jgi:hypothetical protein